VVHLAYDIPLVYLGLAAKDQTFAWLERAHQARSNDMSNLQQDPMFDSLHSESPLSGSPSPMGFPP